MKKFSDVLEQIESSKTPAEGDGINLVINEEFNIKTDIVACNGNQIFLGLDEHAFKILKRAGLLKGINQ